MMKVIRSNFFIVYLVILFSGCASSNDTNQSLDNQERTNLVLAIGGEPDDGFDPTIGWGRYGSPLFQSTLFSLDKELNVVNDVATEYELKNGGKEWLVIIRDDVLFSVGEPLKANDVVFTFETAKNSNSVVDLSNLNKVEKIDDYTVKFTLDQPQSSFIYILIAIGIVPEHHYDENYREHPIGSGPYQFVQWDKGQQLIVEKNPYYYNKQPFFERLTFLFLSEDAAFAAAQAGKVDIVSVSPLFAKEDNIGDMKLINLNSVDNRGIMFPYQESGQSTEDGLPIGNDVTVDISIRKAINIAVNRQSLVDEVLEGFGTPAFSIADHMPWWNEDTVILDGDMDQAIEILESGGWVENEKGIREKDGITATFSLVYPTGDQLRQSLAMTFSEMIKPLGIVVDPEGKSWSDIEKVMHSTPVLMGWGSHDPLEMYHTHSSKLSGQGFNNPNFYENKTVDNYMEQALKAESLEQANEYWKMAQWDGETGFSALGDAPWAWLVNLQHLYYVREELDIGEQKVQPHGHGWPITDFIESWEWKN